MQNTGEMTSHMHPVHFNVPGVQKVFNVGLISMYWLFYDTMKQQVQGGTGDLFQPNNCFTQAALADTGMAPGCWAGGAWAWIAMLPSHFNAFSAETMMFCWVLCGF